VPYRIASLCVEKFLEALEAPDFLTAHPVEEGTTWFVLFAISLIFYDEYNNIAKLHENHWISKRKQ
jgi:hypothetical protein